MESKNSPFTLELVFDRSIKQYRLNEPGTASSFPEGEPSPQVGQKRPATQRAEIVFENSEGQANQSAEADHKSLSQSQFEQEMARAKEDAMMLDYQSRTLVLPSCSAWFKFDEIHEIEAQSLPEFFCGRFPQKTPIVYRQWRNFIIKLYREKPHCYLSATGKLVLFGYRVCRVPTQDRR